ncbi:MAG: radical SAM protein [Kiritimatiellia bacterium]
MLDIKFKFEGGHDDSGNWMAPSPLRTIYWNVTNFCNLQCPVCFSSSGNADNSEMTTEEAKFFLRQAALAGVREIVLSGGEPFQRGDILELLKLIKHLGMGARAASNGLLLTDALLAQLRQETSLRSFMINLDSLDPEVYAACHGASPDTLEKVLAAIRRIQNYGYHTTACVRLMPVTRSGIPALLEFAAREDWRTVTVMLPVHVGRVDEGWLWPPDKDLLGELEPVFEYFATLPRAWRVEVHIPWAPYHPVIKRLEGRVAFSFAGCRSGRASLVVQADGRVVPCLAMDRPEAELGNVLRDDLGQMFRDSPVCQLLREPHRFGVCSDCEFVRQCGGGCRSVALAVTGRLDAPDPTCPLVRESLIRAGGGAHGR